VTVGGQGVAVLPCLACPVCGATAETVGPDGPPAHFDDESSTVHKVADEGTVHAWAARAGYEVLAELGKGGMGVVYKARQKSLGRIVALKMVRTTSMQPATRARFEQEARAAAALDHPGIVPLFDFGVVDDQPYCTMALIEGDSLTGLVKRQGPLPPRQAADLLARVADAVAYAHQRGILHRDLKPDNILVDAQGHPRITDFGLARRLDGGPNLTATGQVIGTPAYMAPEQARGVAELTPAVDVYSLGGVLHAVLVGRAPFSGSSIDEVLRKVTQEAPVPLRQINSALPEALERIVLRCLEKGPARRYASAADLAADLRQWLTVDSAPVAEAVPCAASPPTGTAVAQAPRRRWLALVGGLLLVAVAVAALWQLGVRQGPAAVWSKPLRQDFELKVSLPDIPANREGVHILSAGQTLRIVVESPHDVHFGVWSLQHDRVVQLFPNEYERDNVLRAKQPRSIPGNDRYDIPAAAARQVEFIRVVASTAPWAALTGQDDEEFAVFKRTAPGYRAWEDQQITLRGLKVRPRKQGASASPPQEAVRFSEVVLPYRVQPAR
jgi:tRNA A-37 threonylcarbamoyl transferase component Bud32